MSRAGAKAARVKAQAKAERRAATRPHRDALAAFQYESAFVFSAADFVYVECERCGQEQSLPIPDKGYRCVICGHDVARTSPLHDSHRRALLEGYAERVARIPHLGDGIAA